MSSNDKKCTTEEKFRNSFNRLKEGRPINIPAGSVVSQNNVAKEARLHRSALRKDRFPTLVHEIQLHISSSNYIEPKSQRKSLLKRRKRNRSLISQIEDLKLQRDLAASSILDLLNLIHTLKLQNAALKSDKVEPLPFPSSSPFKPKSVD